MDYDFTATNIGSVRLTDVTITDPLPGLPHLTYGEWPGAPGVLEPGESVSATARYPLGDGDFAAGGVENTATATGTTPADNTVRDSDDAHVTLTPGISLVKDAALAEGAAGVAGDTVTYSFTATNTGSVTLTGVTLEDPKPGLSGVVSGPWPGPDGVLAPGQSVTATASYVLTQEDVDRGGVSNTATVTGTPPTGADVSDDDSAEVTLPGGTASIALTKDAALAAGAQDEVGDVVTYSFTATNTGDVTLTGVEIHDPKDGVYDFAYGEWPGADGVLAPGESVTATALYILTEADVAAGEVHNTATATGTPPTGPEVSGDDEALVSLEPRSGTSGLAVTGVNAAGLLLAAFLLLLGGAAMWTLARHA